MWESFCYRWEYEESCSATEAGYTEYDGPPGRIKTGYLDSRADIIVCMIQWPPASKFIILRSRKE